MRNVPAAIDADESVVDLQSKTIRPNIDEEPDRKSHDLFNFLMPRLDYFNSAKYLMVRTIWLV